MKALGKAEHRFLVQCIRASDKVLKVGTVYTVTADKSYYYEIEGLPGGWYKDRFRRLPKELCARYNVVFQEVKDGT